MDPRRILIVESQQDFALSIAAVLRNAGFLTTIAADTGEAVRELEARCSDLVVLRAELPDQSGFSFCGVLKKGRFGSFPVIIISSEASLETFENHQATPSAADAYLQIPFELESLATTADGLLNSPLDVTEEVFLIETHPIEATTEVSPSATPSAAPIDTPVKPQLAAADEPSDSTDDHATQKTTLDHDHDGDHGNDDRGEGDEDIEAAFGRVSKPSGQNKTEASDSSPPGSKPEKEAVRMPATPPRLPAKPPPVPKRERRSAITEEDRAFLERCFGSIADRKAELLAEAKNQIRRSTKRELLSTPEGKLQLLREEFKIREAQIARISEIWSSRERELLVADDRLHEKDVEIQALKHQVDEFMHRLNDARNVFLQKEQEHGIALDELLLQKFSQEKELIEVVASKEKEINVQKSELRHKEEELSSRCFELESARNDYETLSKQYQVDVLKAELREKELVHTLAVREHEICGLAQDLAKSQEHSEFLKQERDFRLAALDRELRAVKAETASAVGSKEVEIFRTRQSLEEKQAQLELLQEDSKQKQEELRRERDDLLASLGETEQELSDVERERQSLRCQRDGMWQAFSERVAQRDERIAKLEDSLHSERERAVAKENELSARISADLATIGELEGELEAVKAHGETVEEELYGQIQVLSEELERTRGDLALAGSEIEEAVRRYSELEAAKAQSEQQLEERYAALEEAKNQSEQGRDQKYALLMQEKAQSEAQRDEQYQQLLEEKRQSESRLSENIDSLAHELEETRIKAKEREQDLADIISTHQERIQGLESDLSTLEEESARTEKELNEQNANLESTLAKTREAAEEREQGLLEELASRDQRISLMQQEIELLKETRAAEAAQFEQEAAGFRATILQLEDSWARLDKDKSEGDAAFQQQIAIHQAQIGELEEVLENTRQAAMQREDSLQDQIAAGNEQRKLLANKLEEAIAIQQAREKDLLQLRGEIDEEKKEHASTRQEKAEREADLHAARREIDRLEKEVSDNKEAAQAEANHLLSEIEEATKSYETEKKARLADAEIAAARFEEFESLTSRLVGERDLAKEMNSELESELGEVKNALGTREAELTQLRVYLAEAETKVVGLEERLDGVALELSRREELLQKDLATISQELSDEKRKREQATQEARRSNEASHRELTVRGEQIRILEATLAAEQDKVQRYLQDISNLRTAFEAEVAQLQGELAERTGQANELVSKIDEVVAEKEVLRQDMTQGYGQRDAKLSELNSLLAGERAERRREAEGLAANAAREASRAKELLHAMEAAKEERAKIVAEANEKLALRIKRIQEMEQALESAVSAKSRIEREATAKIGQMESRVAELLQRLQMAFREKKSLEDKHVTELEELAQKYKLEVERKEQQRLMEVQRLQQSVQERAKALKVVELELARFKARAGGNPGIGIPRSAAPSARIPSSPAQREEKRPAAVLPITSASSAGKEKEDEEWNNLEDEIDNLEEK